MEMQFFKIIKFNRKADFKLLDSFLELIRVNFRELVSTENYDQCNVGQQVVIKTAKSFKFASCMKEQVIII